MERATNLQKLREHRRLTQDELATETGVPVSRIASAENGEDDLTMEELYDLALFFDTSTSDLIDSDDLAVTTDVDYPENNAYDGLWGHVGILLQGHEHTKWYPITTMTSDSIAEDMQNYEKGFVVFRTLNNRVLFVNPMLIKKIMLNADDADAPPDFEDIADYAAPVYYEALRESYGESMGGDKAAYSAKVRNALEAYMKQDKVDEEKMKDILLNTFIYYGDGSSERYSADSEHLSNIWGLGYNVDIPLISIPERNNAFDCWYSGRGIALIDTPYLEMDEICQEQVPGKVAKKESAPVGKRTKGALKGKKKAVSPP